MSIDLSRYTDDELSELYVGHEDMARHCIDVGQWALARYHRSILPLIVSEAANRACMAVKAQNDQLRLC